MKAYKIRMTGWLEPGQIIGVFLGGLGVDGLTDGTINSTINSFYSVISQGSNYEWLHLLRWWCSCIYWPYSPHKMFNVWGGVLQKGRFNTVSSYLILAQLSEAFLFFLCLRFGKAISTRKTVNQLSREKWNILLRKDLLLCSSILNQAFNLNCRNLYSLKKKKMLVTVRQTENRHSVSVFMPHEIHS